MIRVADSEDVDAWLEGRPMPSEIRRKAETKAVLQQVGDVI